LSCETWTRVWKRVWRDRLDSLLRYDPSHGYGILSRGRKIAKMTLANPFISPRLSQQAGPAPSMSFWNGVRTGRKGRRLAALPWANLETQPRISSSLSVVLQCQITPQERLPRGSWSSPDSAKPPLERSRHQPCSCALMSLEFDKVTRPPVRLGAHLGWGEKGAARRGRSPRSQGSSRRWCGCRRGHSNRWHPSRAGHSRQSGHGSTCPAPGSTGLLRPGCPAGADQVPAPCASDSARCLGLPGQLVATAAAAPVDVPTWCLLGPGRAEVRGQSW
jgi:hypothetical protein